MDITFEEVEQKLRTTLNGMPHDVIQIMGLFGVNEGIFIVLASAAFVVSYYMAGAQTTTQFKSDREQLTAMRLQMPPPTQRTHTKVGKPRLREKPYDQFTRIAPQSSESAECHTPFQ